MIATALFSNTESCSSEVTARLDFVVILNLNHLVSPVA